MLQASRSNSNDVTFTLHVETDPRAKAEFEAMKRAGIETQAALRGQGVGPGQSAGGIGGNRWGDLQKEVDAAKERIKLREQENKQLDAARQRTNDLRGGVADLTKGFIALGIASRDSLAHLIDPKTIESIATIGSALYGMKNIVSGAIKLGGAARVAGAAISAGATTVGGAAAGTALAAAGPVGAAIAAGGAGWFGGRALRNTELPFTGGFKIGNWVDKNIWGYTDQDIKEADIGKGYAANETDRNAEIIERRGHLLEQRYRVQSNARYGIMRMRNAGEIERYQMAGDAEGAMRAGQSHIDSLQREMPFGGADMQNREEEIIHALERQKTLIREAAQERERGVTAELHGAQQVSQEADRQLRTAQQKLDLSKSEYERTAERFARASPAERAMAEAAAIKQRNGEQLTRREEDALGVISPALASQSARGRAEAEGFGQTAIGSPLRGKITESQELVTAYEKALQEAKDYVGRVSKDLITLQKENKQNIENAFKAIENQIVKSAEQTAAYADQRIGNMLKNYEIRN